MKLPTVKEVINTLDNSAKTVDFNIPSSFTSEELSTLSEYRKELLLKIAQVKQLDFDLLNSMAMAIEFTPFSTNQLQEYLEEDLDCEEIYECIYDDSDAFFAEGIIYQCIANASKLLKINGLNPDFIQNNIDEIIEECIALDGCEDDNSKFLTDEAIYNNSVDYVAYWIRIGITQYLEMIAEEEEVEEIFNQKEEELEIYYSMLKKLLELQII